MADRTVKVKLTADTSDYQRGMRDSQKSTTELEKAQQKAQRTSELWQKVGLASKVAGAAIAFGLYKAGQAASNQEQAMGSLGAVFKENTAIMETNAKAAVKIGLSQTQYAESAAQLGAQLTNLGLDQQDVAGTTDDLINKAADMAAQFGGSTADAVTALSALLRGERDPIEQYGVGITEASLKAEMAATGFSKIEATLSLLNKQLANTNTIGAAAREYDTTASAAQRMAAEFGNAQAELGEALLPAMTAAAEAAGKLFSSFNSLPGPLKQTATLIAAVGAVALIAGPKLLSMRASMAAIQAESTRTAVAMQRLNASMGMLGKAGAWGAAFAAIAAGMDMWGDKIRDLRFGDTTEDIGLLEQQLIRFAQTGTSEVGLFGNELGNLATEIANSGSVLEAWGSNMDGLRVDKVNDQLDLVDDALASLAAKDPDAAAASFGRISNLAKEAGIEAEKVNEVFNDYVVTQQAAAVAAENAEAAQNGFWAAYGRARDAITEQTAAVEAQREAVKALASDLMRLMSINLALSGSQDALIGQTGRLRAVVEEHGNSLRGQTKAAAANRDAMRSELGLINQVAQATYEKVEASRGGAEAEGAVEAATAAANKVIRSNIGELKANAAAAGYSKKEVNAFVASVLKVPNKAATKVDTPGAKDSKRWIDLVIGAANTADKTDPNVAVSTNASSVAGAVNSLNNSIRSLPTRYDIGIYYTRYTLGNVPVGAQRAAGGPIHGPGTATSDSIPAWLSDGEYVIKAAAVAKYGTGLMDKINSMALAEGGQVDRFRTGGRATRKKKDEPTKAEEKAAEKAKQRKQNRRDFERSIRDAVERGLSGMGAFDFGAQARALEELARSADSLESAQDALAAARIKANTASPGERASALRELADAEENLADAQQERADAETAAANAAPTPKNILAAYEARAKAAEQFQKKLKSLTKKGLDKDLVREFALAGPDSLDQLKALDGMSGKDLASLNKKQGRLERAAGGISRFEGKQFFAGGGAARRTRANRTDVRITGGAPIVIKLGDRELAKSQLRMVRRKGGTYDLKLKK